MPVPVIVAIISGVTSVIVAATMLTDFLLHSDMKGGDIMAGVIMPRHDLFGGSRRRRLFILY